ncbi:MAG: hypothetical protein GF411_19420 [Candidatus Lokiarchaeota archaeon]|nr:hypothetical protein [Candidatus Lokiarchaeota archaeon]
MSYGETLRTKTEEEFTRAKLCLLPNESVEFVCQSRNGFLVLSHRRLAILEKSKDKVYTISQAIPLECVSEISEKKKDKVKVSCKKHSKSNTTFEEIEMKAPKAKRGEDKDAVRKQFEDSMKHFQESVNNILHQTPETLLNRDLSYLHHLPDSLTRNAVLDLNIILQDQPIYDSLYYEGLKYLGPKPFLIEETVRIAEERENGVLFAAGKQGFIMIQGRKDGRFISDVLVDKIEWRNISSLSYEWQNEGVFEVAYSLQQGAKEKLVRYVWSPTVNEDVREYHWLWQCLNGPWIIEDIFAAYSDGKFSQGISVP